MGLCKPHTAPYEWMLVHEVKSDGRVAANSTLTKISDKDHLNNPHDSLVISTDVMRPYPATQANRNVGKRVFEIPSFVYHLTYAQGHTPTTVVS